MNPSLQTSLRQLRLSGMSTTLDVRLQEAGANRLTHEQFLELIVQDEMAVRAERRISAPRALTLPDHILGETLGGGAGLLSCVTIGWVSKHRKESPR
ncbi:MAG: hypothetical protein WC485_11550 [Opitutaceae bacterium]